MQEFQGARSIADSPEYSDSELESYRIHIKKFCHERKIIRGIKVSIPLVVKIREVLDVVRADLGLDAFDILTAEYLPNRKLNHKSKELLPAHAWSRHYERCQGCKKVDRKHYCGGRCTRCYHQEAKARREAERRKKDQG